MQNIVNIVGLIALITYARLGRNAFFYYLEQVVLLGTLLNIFQVSGLIKGMALVLAAGIALVWVLQDTAYRVWYTSLGVVGLAGLAFGYATLNPLGYVIGGLGSIAYSLISYSKGVTSAMVFALLNIIYTLLALYSLFS